MVRTLRETMTIPSKTEKTFRYTERQLTAVHHRWDLKPHPISVRRTQLLLSDHLIHIRYGSVTETKVL